MSQQDNVALIRNTYKAFGEGDIQTILASLDDGVEWTNHGPATIPYAGTRHGRAQVLEFFQAIDSSTTGGKVTADSFVSEGDIVIATGRYSAVVRNTGAQIDSPVAHVFSVRNGKITKWVGYSDTAHIAAAHTGAAAAAAYSDPLRLHRGTG